MYARPMYIVHTLQTEIPLTVIDASMSIGGLWGYVRKILKLAYLALK